MEGSLRILVVEDDLAVLKLISFLLKKNYYKVDEVHYEVELMDIAKKKSPGIIIIDIELENMDSIDIIRKLKEDNNTQDIPILCVSNKGNELRVMRALQEGASSYIVKPFTPNDLLDRLVASMKKE